MARTVAASDPSYGHQARREALARLLAAEIMGLRDDPLGERLPEECWSQVLMKADAAMLLVAHTQDAKLSMASHNKLP